ELGADLAGLDGVGVALLAAHGVGVAALLGDGGEAVVDVLRGLAHHQRGRVDDLVGHEPRVRVHALTHRVPAHVLDAAGDRDVVGAEGDAARHRGDGGHGACAHAVDRVAGDGLRQAGQQGGGAADGQALVTDLRGRGDRDVVDALRRKLGVAAQQLADDLDDQIVGPRVGVDALVARLAEGGSYSVDEVNGARGCVHGCSFGSLGLESWHTTLLPACTHVFI